MLGSVMTQILAFNLTQKHPLRAKQAAFCLKIPDDEHCRTSCAHHPRRPDCRRSGTDGVLACARDFHQLVQNSFPLDTPF
jgi:hypothetical protein